MGAELSDDRDVIAAVRTLTRVGRLLERTDSGLSLPQFRLLSLLAYGDERSTALAQRLAVSKPTISSAVDALVERGHLRRRSDLGDRRVTWLQITDSGQAALDHAERAYLERLRPVLGRLSDPSGFVAAVDELSQAMDADRAARHAQREASRQQATEHQQASHTESPTPPSRPSTQHALKGAVAE